MFIEKNSKILSKDSVSIEVNNNSVKEESILFSRNFLLKTKNLRLHSVDNIHFSKNSKVHSNNIELYAKKCIQDKHVKGLGNSCSNPLPPVVNEVPISVLSCSTNRISLFCDGRGSTDSDGTITTFKFLINGELFENNVGYISKRLDTGIYNIELQVVDNEGAISNTSQDTVEILANESPVVDFDCEITDDLNLVCNAENSYDPDDTELNYLWKVNGSFFNGVSNTFEFGYATEVSVELTVSDNFGGSSSISKIVIIVPLNVPPVAQLVCDSKSPGYFKCDATNSVDFDGSISRYQFSVNNQVYENTSGVFESSDYVGNITVSLKVFDNLEASSDEIHSNFFVSDNIAPVAKFSCDSTKVYQLSCDGSESTDSDGSISSYIWYVNGEHIQTGNDPKLLFDRVGLTQP